MGPRTYSCICLLMAATLALGAQRAAAEALTDPLPLPSSSDASQVILIAPPESFSLSVTLTFKGEPGLARDVGVPTAVQSPDSAKRHATVKNATNRRQTRSSPFKQHLIFAYRPAEMPGRKACRPQSGQRKRAQSAEHRL